MANQLQVGPQVTIDGQICNSRADNDGCTVISSGAPLYHEAVRRGYGFIYSQAATGIALAVPGTGAKTNFMIWNPISSGRLFIPLKVSLGLVSTATVVGNIALYGVAAAGDQVGTAAPVVSYTAGTPTPALFGSANSSMMRFAPAVENLTVAPAFIKTLGWSALANDLASKTTWNFESDLDGQIMFKPGTALVIGTSTAMASVCVISVFGIELPMPVGM